MCAQTEQSNPFGFKQVLRDIYYFYTKLEVIILSDKMKYHSPFKKLNNSIKYSLLCLKVKWHKSRLFSISHKWVGI
jgi:hypothetical protein